MTDLKNILVATDFSEGAEATYPVAQKLAATFGSKVDMIHIIPTFSYLNESLRNLGSRFDVTKDIFPKIIEESEHLCEKALNAYIDEPNQGRVVVKVDRKPADAIVNYARDGGYDLILIGAKGREKSRMLRGSTTEKVIRNSTVPVFCMDRSFRENGPEKILVPTDTSDVSFSALPMAAILADTWNAELILFHVIELFGSYSENIPPEKGKKEKISVYETLIERLNHYFEDSELENFHIQRTGVIYEDELVISSDDGARIVPVKTEIEKGISAHFEIESFAEANTDLVVIATHGHTGFAHLVLGSTAEKVAQYVTKPVITVRPEAGRLKKVSQTDQST